MNDYTKNISSSCWSPGLYVDQRKLVTINDKYDKNRTRKVRSKFENSKPIEQSVKGFPGKVQGKIGEKFMTIDTTTEVRRRPQRPKSAVMPTTKPSKNNRAIVLK